MSHLPDWPFVSVEVHAILMALSLHDGVSGHSRRQFPDALGPGVRGAHSENASEWFRRVVDTFFNGDASRFAIDRDEKLGVLADVHYVDAVISKANVQALIVEENDLIGLYDAVVARKPLPRHHYLRLDYHPDEPGPLFNEPLPHVHTRPKGAPRFALPSPTGNLLVDFFDYIYRTWFHDTWFEWAERVLAKHAENGELDLSLQAGHPGAGDPRAPLLSALKSACRETKDMSFRHRLDIARAAALNYDD